MAPHSSTLAWKIPWMEEPGRLQSMGSLRVGHNWATSLSLFPFMHRRRKWQPTPAFLPGESQGWGSLVGCHLWGHTELDTTEATQHQQISVIFERTDALAMLNLPKHPHAVCPLIYVFFDVFLHRIVFNIYILHMFCYIYSKYFHLWIIINGIVFLISVSTWSLPVRRNAIEFLKSS